MRGAWTLALVADVAVVDRNVPPADHALPLGLDRSLEEPLELGAARIVLREEADPDAVRAGRRQVRIDHRAHEPVRHLQEDSGAVAGRRVGAGGASVLEVREGA